MARVKVSCNELTNYGTFLEEKAQEFKSILSKMEEVINSLGSSWTGYDASNFMNNATAYIKNLQNLEAIFTYYGSSVRAKSAQYHNMRVKFYEILTK